MIISISSNFINIPIPYYEYYFVDHEPTYEKFSQHLEISLDGGKSFTNNDNYPVHPNSVVGLKLLEKFIRKYKSQTYTTTNGNIIRLTKPVPFITLNLDELKILSKVSPDRVKAMTFLNILQKLCL